MENKLNQFLADLSVMAKKVQNYHWNIVGKGFFSVHAKLDDLYESLNESVDEVAERILALDGRPLSNLESYLKITKITEAPNEQIDIPRALENIINDYKYLINEAKEVKKAADEAEDFGTSAMMDEFIIDKEKIVWMLRSIVK